MQHDHSIKCYYQHSTIFSTAFFVECYSQHSIIHSITYYVCCLCILVLAFSSFTSCHTNRLRSVSALLLFMWLNGVDIENGPIFLTLYYAHLSSLHCNISGNQAHLHIIAY